MHIGRSKDFSQILQSFYFYDFLPYLNSCVESSEVLCVACMIKGLMCVCLVFVVVDFLVVCFYAYV